MQQADNNQTDTKSSKTTRFYLVRHGQTIWNTKKIMQGHLDSPLTAEGEKQAAQTGQQLQDVNFDQVFSSDLGRAYQTAQIIAANQDVQIKTTRLLRETNIGPFSGKKLVFFREQLKESIAYRETLTEAEAMDYAVHPEVETYNQMAERMLRFFRETALAYPGQTILSVSHAGTIRATLVRLGVGTNREIPHGCIKNASYVVIDCDGVEFWVRELVGVEVQKKI